MKNSNRAVMAASRGRSAIRLICGVGALILLAGTPRVLASGDAADQAMAKIRPEAIRAEMSFLSDDLLEGRGTATRGHEIAAKYMATQYEGMGLEPAGDKGTYIQEVPLRAMRIDQAKSSITLTRGDKKETLVFGKDYILKSDLGRAESTVEAPMVFVGFGVTASGQGYDDYKGIDAKGKIVACLFGAPNFESALKAHYSSSIEKARNAVAHGAAGMIVLDDPDLERSYPFQKFVRDLVNPQFKWLDQEGRPNDYFPELEGVGLFSISATEKLFAGAEHSAEEIYAAEKKGQTYSFALPITARLHTVTHSKDVRSPNVAAKIEGSDPVLKNEYVVYSAHLDHLGIGEPVNGDKIYNGALDNASGSAMLLEMARAFSSMKPKPRRSILFLSVTGEEEGLLGSDYFAHYPTVEKHEIVADVNVDEVFMLWPMKDIVAFGAEHSSLEGVIQKATKRMDLIQSPDPVPNEVVFIRSDQYSFVKQGIPSVMPSPGFQSSDPNIHPMEVFQKWEATRYHEPQDDMEQPGLDFNAAAEFARFAFLCGYYVSEETARPAWNKGDFFGEHYGPRAK